MNWCQRSKLMHFNSFGKTAFLPPVETPPMPILIKLEPGRLADQAKPLAPYGLHQSPRQTRVEQSYLEGRALTSTAGVFNHDAPASTSNAKAAPARKVMGAPPASRRRPAIRFDNSKATTLTRLNMPKDVPRRPPWRRWRSADPKNAQMVSSDWRKPNASPRSYCDVMSAIMASRGPPRIPLPTRSAKRAKTPH